MPRTARGLQICIDGDTNSSDWWNDSNRPAFEAAHPGHTFNVTITRGVADGAATIARRALAAFQSKTDPQADHFEGFDPRNAEGSVEAGTWTTFDATA